MHINKKLLYISLDKVNIKVRLNIAFFPELSVQSLQNTAGKQITQKRDALFS